MIAMLAALTVGCGNARIETVGVEEFEAVCHQEGVRLVDVRTPQEYAEGHLAGAEIIDIKAANFSERIQDMAGTVAVYCRSGKRSLAAAEQLAGQGCTVYNLDGGILAWQKAGRPTTTESDTGNIDVHTRHHE